MGIKSLFAVLILCNLLTGCLQSGSPFFNHNPFKFGGEAEVQNNGETQPNGQGEVTLVTKNPEKPFRPRVFLVLGPGMSRTFAHLGVLKILAVSEIKISAVVGMGWAGLAAAEYAGQGSVHGLEWKLSRSEELKGLTKTSFWSQSLVEKDATFVKRFASEFLTEENKSNAVSKAYFPLLSLRARKLVFSAEKGLGHSMSVPPLFNSGNRYEPYLFNYDELIKKAVSFGAEKVILIDVLTSEDGFFAEKVEDSALRSYWAFASQSLYQSHQNFDKVFKINIDTKLTDFNNPLELVKSGENVGERLVEFLKSEYQY